MYMRTCTSVVSQGKLGYMDGTNEHWTHRCGKKQGTLKRREMSRDEGKKGARDGWIQHNTEISETQPHMRERQGMQERRERFDVNVLCDVCS